MHIILYNTLIDILYMTMNYVLHDYLLSTTRTNRAVYFMKFQSKIKCKASIFDIIAN